MRPTNLVYLTCMLTCLSLGLLSGVLSNSGDTQWYLHLMKPSFNPPSFIFGPIWTVLYLLMGYALANIWTLRNKHPEFLTLFISQFSLNFIWSPLFFLFHQIDLALFDLFLMWLLFLVLVYKTKSFIHIIIPLIPTAIWISFALILNFNLWALNKSI
jgi:benzodiazapine receptor